MTQKDTPAYLGIDIGGTYTRVGRLRTLDEAYFTQIARFPTQQNYELQLRMLFAALADRALKRIDGIGVALGGRMAKDGRSVLVAPNLPDYVGKSCAHDLEAHFQCPIQLAHDTVCGLLGEKKFGPLQANERCAYLTLSTGTGAAFQLRKASMQLTVSIEIGHQLLDGNPLVCLCGQISCLETFTGGRQLEMRLGHTLAQEKDAAFWEIFSDKLALGLVNLTHLTRVEAIAISGAILLNNPFLLPLLQQKVDARLHGASVQLHKAALEANAPLVGAALLLETPQETIIH